MRRLALFDLDHTLLAGDSDFMWGQFLVDRGLVDGPAYERENRRFYEEYKAGTLDIRAFLRFSLRPLTEHDPAKLIALRTQFLDRVIRPIIAPLAMELLRRHRARGDELVIITATNHFITEPIAGMLGVEHLLATEPEIVNGRYTGEIAGIPCFQAGKVQRLQQWLRTRAERFGERWFYSDSQNDIPLLETVDHPVAIDADAPLSALAKQRGWAHFSLRGRDLPAGWP